MVEIFDVSGGGGPDPFFDPATPEDRDYIQNRRHPQPYEDVPSGNDLVCFYDGQN